MEPAWDHEALKAWFTARQGQDVLETELLDAFFPGGASGKADLALYRKHFLLYRRLWLFDDELRLSTGHRLWIRGIRSTFLDPPPVGRCGWLGESGRYCLEPLENGRCPFHDGTQLELNSVKSYYLDAANLGMTEEGVQKLMDDFFRRWGSGPIVDDALKVLGLPAGADLKTIKARWRQLSLAHHPDRGGDAAYYQTLSQAWTVLKSRR